MVEKEIENEEEDDETRESVNKEVGREPRGKESRKTKTVPLSSARGGSLLERRCAALASLCLFANSASRSFASSEPLQIVVLQKKRNSVQNKKACFFICCS